MILRVVDGKKQCTVERVNNAKQSSSHLKRQRPARYSEVVTYCSTSYLFTSCSLRENDITNHPLYSKQPSKKTKAIEKKKLNTSLGNPVRRKTKRKRKRRREDRRTER